MQHPRVVPISIFILLFALPIWAETVHTMAAGDTTYSLSRRYGVSVEAILEHNGITDPTRIAIGTRIRIPDGDATDSTPAPAAYTVQPGDYPYAIAAKLGVNWLDLLAANNLTRNDIVHPGDVLEIPGQTREENDGQVASGSDDTGDTDTITPTPVAHAPVAIDWPHPGAREVWRDRFPGITMAAAEGDEFRAVASGTVTIVSPYGSFGRIILVKRSDDYVYAYLGAEEVAVSVGDHVEAGTVLGSVGYSSAFESAKVLLAVLHNNQYIDPVSAPRG